MKLIKFVLIAFLLMILIALLITLYYRLIALKQSAKNMVDSFKKKDE